MCIRDRLREDRDGRFTGDVGNALFVVIVDCLIHDAEGWVAGCGEVREGGVDLDVEVVAAWENGGPGEGVRNAVRLAGYVGHVEAVCADFFSESLESRVGQLG